MDGNGAEDVVGCDLVSEVSERDPFCGNGVVETRLGAGESVLVVSGIARLCPFRVAVIALAALDERVGKVPD